MTKKYTEEESQHLIKVYTDSPSPETVTALALHYDRSEKSIISKLAREGVYRKKQYLSKTGEPPVLKKEYVADICEMLGLEELEGLDKTPKMTLKKLESAIRDRFE